MGETVGQVVTLTDFHCLDEFNGKSFGLRNTPATFQRLMNTILAKIQGLRCPVYLDDIIIYGPSLEKRFIEVMQRLRKYNLKLQPDKCEFLSYERK